MELGTFDIDELLFRVLEKRAGQEDIVYFSKWIKDEEHREYFEKIKKLWNLSAGGHVDQISLEKGLDDYRHFMRKASMSKKLKKMVWCMTAIAAVVAMIIVSIVWNYQRDEIPMSKHVSMGQKGIILTMSDGKKVNVLSDTASLVGKSGEDVKVNRISPREIVYEVTDSCEVLPEQSLVYNEIIVPAGERMIIQLSDGTRVWINSESSLRYPTRFGKEKREIEVRGNVYMEVKKDSLHPFVVKTREIETEVLGTSFEVNTYGDRNEVSATLVEGSVRVKAGVHLVIIEPNQQFVYNTQSGVVEVLSVDALNKVRWTEGVLVIDNERFDDVIWKLERWYGVTIVNETGILFSQFFSGEFDREDIRAAIQTMCMNLNISFVMNEDKIILKK